MPLPTFYTAAEVAAALKIRRESLYDLVSAGKVNPLRLSDGSRSPMRFTDEDIAHLIRELRPAPVMVVPLRRRRRRRY